MRASLGVLLLAGSMVAASAAPPRLPAEFLPLDEVRPGMKGYGLSVFRGTAVERFDVEVIGVQRAVAPDRGRIFVRVAGQGLEVSGVAAGMSGSPVYLEGRLAGAIAVSWGFAKVPLAGVTPIESMLDVDGIDDIDGIVGESPKHQTGVGGTSPPLPFLRLPGEGDEELAARLEGVAGRLLAGPAGAPATGLLASVATGFPDSTLERFGPLLARLGLPLRSGVPSAPWAAAAAGPPSPAGGPLRPGSSIAALLVDGDLQLAAVGTVTWVSPSGRFVAFGHPLMEMGELDLPVAPAEVITILPSYFQSFKVAVPSSSAGAFRLVRDRDAGVAGRSDRTGATVPVRVRFAGPESKVEKTFTFRVASHPKLLPSLLAFAADAVLRTSDPTSTDRTLDYRVRLGTRAGPIEWHDVASGPKSREIVLLTSALLASTAVDNDFQDAGLEEVDLEFRSRPGERRLRILEASASRRKVAPGETVAVAVLFGGRREEERSEVVHLEVPLDTPEGRATLLVADGSVATAFRRSHEPGEPRSLADLRRVLASVSPSERLSVFLSVPGRSAVTGAQTLTSLPPSIAGLLAGRSAGETRAEGEGRIVAEANVTFDRPLAGSVRLDLDIERPRR